MSGGGHAPPLARSPKDLLLVIVGPTAAGKSAVAESLAVGIGGQLISADALQLYRGLDIGTAKPSPAAQQRIRHHCLDVLDPDGFCSAAQYARLARAAIESVRRDGDVPILVGGSGFYAQAAIDGMAPLPSSSTRWRSVLEGMVGRHGAAAMYGFLGTLDPVRARQIDGRDMQRTVRALEVVLRTGRRFADLNNEGPTPAGRGGVPTIAAEHLPPLRHDAVWIGITRPRDQLYDRIEQRVDEMLAAGWLAEVRALLASGLSTHTHALQAIGYRQLAAVIEHRADLQMAREAIVRGTRRYAKRQISWFRRNERIDWTTLGSGPDGLSTEAASAAIQDRIGRASAC